MCSALRAVDALRRVQRRLAQRHGRLNVDDLHATDHPERAILADQNVQPLRALEAVLSVRAAPLCTEAEEKYVFSRT